MAISISGEDPSPAEERRRCEGAAPQAGDAAGDLSNTPPSIPKIPSCDLTTGGEDWLDFALDLNHSRFKQLAERLDQAKQLAEQGGVAQQVLRGHTYSIGPGAGTGKGRKRVHYRWRLVADNGLTILLMNREKHHETMANALASARSVLLMSEGPERVWQQIQDALEDLGAKLVANKLSRVDACIDLPGVKVEQFTRPYAEGHYVTRARKAAEHEYEEMFTDLSGATYRLGSRSTGVTVGSCDILLRIYDKAHELRFQPEKRHLMLHRRWGEPVIHASRVEFQVRRERLKSLGVDSFNDWLAKRGKVLEYLTEKWFRFTEGPYNSKHSGRTPTLGAWQLVQRRAQEWAGQPAGTPLVPIYAEPPRLEQFVRQAIGVMVTAMARENVRVTSNGHFLDELIERVEEVIDARDMAAEVY
jgi:hypothetical protein